MRSAKTYKVILINKDGEIVKASEYLIRRDACPEIYKFLEEYKNDRNQKHDRRAV